MSFEGGESLTMVLAGKRQTLPARSASEVTLEVAPIANDAAVAVIRVQSAEGRWLGLLGGRSGSELLFFERADPIGDPGERRAREIVVGDQQVRTGVRYEGVTACGPRAAWLDAKAIDPNTLTLLPAQQPALPTAFDDATVSALNTPTVPPVLPGLSASASSALDGPTQLPRVPRALVDGDLSRGVPVRSGDLLALRWNNGALPIERFELALKSPKQVELWLLGEGERGVRAIVPGSGARRVAIALPAPMAGRCLAVVVAAGDGLELRELAAYGALDQPGGLDRAIGMMVQDDAQAGPLADQLAQLGPTAAERLAARWPELSPRGKRRSLKVLARALDREPVRNAILDSARSEDPELRDAAIAALERAGEPGHAALRVLVATPGPTGDRAATLLARPEELPALLAALAAEGGSERSALREAIEAALRKDPTRAAIAPWVASAPNAPAQIALVLALSRAGLASDGAQLADTLLDKASAFPERYRLARALAFSTPSAASDAWLTRQAAEAQEWMQRIAAFDALVLRNAVNVPVLADKLSHDPYPRVRAASLVPLLIAGRRAMVDVMLVQDEWPLVRAEAAIALARAPNNRAALESALGDDSARVRRAAVDALTLARSAASWPGVEKRARAATEALDVRMAAVSFAGTLCLPQARGALHDLAARLDAPDATDAETELALEAVRTLHALGGEAQQDGAALVKKLGTPELATMWGRLPAGRCGVPST
ncbi:MAG TPA: hypothetical protein VFX59_02855 [Polyangiales bacterium]|nr:hypothetical protein [Polyangiales bacterium]